MEAKQKFLMKQFFSTIQGLMKITVQFEPLFYQMNAWQDCLLINDR